MMGRYGPQHVSRGRPLVHPPRVQAFWNPVLSGDLRAGAPVVPWLLAAVRSVAPVHALPTADAHSDASLVQRGIEGDRWALEQLYRRHVGRVTNAVTRVIGRVSEADDIVQETFLIGFSRLDKLRDPAAFRGWVAQIAMNETRMRLRRRKWRRRLSLDRDEDDASLERLACEAASPEVRAELRKLDARLAQMPAEQRMAWMLRYVEGWELTEVATALDVSLATAKRRIKAAREHIDAHVRGGWRAR